MDVMNKYVWILLLLAGCATMSSEDREYNMLVERNNWATCERVYERQGRPTLHVDHSHVRGANRDSQEWVKMDLLTNQCREILKPAELWEEKL